MVSPNNLYYIRVNFKSDMPVKDTTYLATNSNNVYYLTPDLGESICLTDDSLDRLKHHINEFRSNRSTQSIFNSIKSLEVIKYSLSDVIDTIEL